MEVLLKHYYDGGEDIPSSRIGESVDYIKNCAVEKPDLNLDQIIRRLRWSLIDVIKQNDYYYLRDDNNIVICTIEDVDINKPWVITKNYNNKIEQVLYIDSNIINKYVCIDYEYNYYIPKENYIFLMKCKEANKIRQKNNRNSILLELSDEMLKWIW